LRAKKQDKKQEKEGEKDLKNSLFWWFKKKILAKDFVIMINGFMFCNISGYSL
jgi:hypothetical protein